MYSYQNTENSQNKHQILNRIVKSIEKQVKYNEVDDYFWKLIKKQDKLLKIARVNNQKVDETIKAIKKVHPYEEPVINVIPLLKVGI